MRYISTRGTAPELNFEEAMLSGLARDGGLYLPKCVPILSKETILEFKGSSYEEIAYTVMEPFVGDAFSREEFQAIINKS